MRHLLFLFAFILVPWQILGQGTQENHSESYSEEHTTPYICSILQDTAYIQNETFVSDTTIVASYIEAGYNVTTSKPQGAVVIQSGKTTLKGSGGVTLKNSFTVNVGASLEINNE